jgi:hypothetical protein
VPPVSGFGNRFAIKEYGGREAQRFLAGEVGHFQIFQADALLVDGHDGTSW